MTTTLDELLPSLAHNLGLPQETKGSIYLVTLSGQYPM